jgi:hypothetical protein
MSERLTQSQTSSTTEAEGQRRDARPGSANVRRSGPAVQPPFARAEPSHQSVPYRIERATLYDPEPLDPSPPSSFQHAATLPPPRSLLPVALTLLGVVVVVGLTAGVIFVRNSEGSRTEVAGRPEQHSERQTPPPDVVGRRADEPVPYDLTRRPTDSIVGAWRETKDESRQTTSALKPEREKTLPDVSQRRPLPQRFTLPRWLQDERLAKDDKKPAEAAETASAAASSKIEPEAASGAAGHVATEPSDKGGSNVVARVGRTTKPAEPDPAPPAKAPRRRSVDADDDDGGRRVKANQMSVSRYRIWKMQRARARANRPDPYDVFLTEKAAQGIRFYGVQRQAP